MMGVYIKGMEMPIGCENCKLKYRHQGFTVTDYCWLKKEIIDPWTFGRSMNGERPEWCPLVPVPPHGDLIDRGMLKNKKIVINYDEWDDTFDDGLLFVCEQIDNAATVIPADTAEEGD